MAGFAPSQVSFAGGEISPRLHGRVDSDLYRRAVKTLTNFMPLSHGPARMRAGTRIFGNLGIIHETRRAIRFNVSGGEPCGMILSDGLLSIRNYQGVVIDWCTNQMANGTFDAGSASWSLGGTWAWNVGGFLRATASGGGVSANQSRSWSPLTSYTVRYRARGTAGATLTVQEYSPTDLNVVDTLTEQWQIFTHTWTTSNVSYSGPLYFLASGTGTYWDVDDVFVTDNTEVPQDTLSVPWTGAQLDTIQYDQDLTKNRMLLVHGNVAPQLLTLNVHGFFELAAATFVGAPTRWGGTNWPSIIDWGYQGRLWLGADPDSPNSLNGSQSGYPFTFTLGGADPDDPVEFNASVRGAIRWMQGQKSLLLGAERVEQAASGGATVIAPGNIQVEEQSAFGSAPIQAAHLGDEVVFVGRDRKEIRALSFDANVKNGWVSRALSFVAEHLVRDVKELHYAASPDPMIIAVLDDRSMVACVYDRGENVAGWWRIDLGGEVYSAAVLDTTAGSELWVVIRRGPSFFLEMLPLHQYGVAYLDAMVSSPPVTNLAVAAMADTINIDPPVPGGADWTVGSSITINGVNGGNGIFANGVGLGFDIEFAAGGRLVVTELVDDSTALAVVLEEPVASVQGYMETVPGVLGGGADWFWRVPTHITGLSHLEGTVVKVVVDGQMADDQVVANGMALMSVVPTVGGTAGLSYTATLVQLPLEGGLQSGSSQGAKRRRTKVKLRLNDSALPLVNGKRPAERVPADPMDTGTDLVTGDVELNVLGWEEDGALTITQDVPFRTEILAIFGSAQVNEV